MSSSFRLRHVCFVVIDPARAIMALPSFCAVKSLRIILWSMFWRQTATHRQRQQSAHLLKWRSLSYLAIDSRNFLEMYLIEKVGSLENSNNRMDGRSISSHLVEPKVRKQTTGGSVCVWGGGGGGGDVDVKIAGDSTVTVSDSTKIYYLIQI